ncbi:MAG: hypothetical protein AB7P20_05675 [Rhizobiaceae bacterium]
MSSIAPARNVIDWVSGAWANVQAQSNRTNIPILDAVTGADDSLLSDGLGVDDGAALASQFHVIQMNLLEGQGVIAGQIAFDRIKNQIKEKFAANSVNKLV